MVNLALCIALAVSLTGLVLSTHWTFGKLQTALKVRGME